MKLHVLELGMLETATEVMIPGVDDGGRLRLYVNAFLIEHDKGLVLVDTGMADEHVGNPLLTWGGTFLENAIVPDTHEGDEIVTQLAKIGFTPDQVNFVINTHFHFDHAGNNQLFTNATVIAQKSHLEYARKADLFHSQYWDNEDSKFQLVDGDVEVLPGIDVIVTNGHAIGHQSVYVHLDNDADMLLAGDALTLHQSLELDNWDGHVDPAAAREGGLRLQAIAEENEAFLVLSHDEPQQASLRKAPEYYS
jgi:N-acyl homoserine lactone hydrolase